MNLEKYDQIRLFKEEAIDSKDTISIMSYNIGYLSGMTNNRAVNRDQSLFTNNLRRSIDLIKGVEPDIAGFQEIDYDSKRSFETNQLYEIVKGCNFYNAHISVNWDKTYVPFPYFPPTSHFGKVLSGQSLVTGFPILDSERIVLDKPQNTSFFYKAFYIDRLIQVSKLKVNNVQVCVLNVHLEAFDAQSRMAQAKVVSNHFSKYSSDFPTLLIGDFNAEPYDINPVDSTFSIIMNSGNIAHAFDKDEFLSSKSNGRTFSSVNPQKKIDYVFFTPDKILPISYKVLTEAGDISDHLPILFYFKLR